MLDFISTVFALALLCLIADVTSDVYARLCCAYCRKFNRPCKRIWCRDKCELYTMPVRGNVVK